MAERTFSIVRKTRGTLPRVPFLRLKEAILGKSYDLSLAFVGPKESRLLNRECRKKDKPANVLSFPLSAQSGEIVLCLSEARRGAPAHGLSYRAFVGLLFIHGALHLKGLDHGSRMEKKERAFRARFLR